MAAYEDLNLQERMLLKFEVEEFLFFEASLLDAEEMMSGDRYVFYRDVYVQNREVLETGGQVKDEFSEFDNDWDEDDF